MRTLRIYGIHVSASYHDTLSSLMKNQNEASKQHLDLGKSRLQRDHSKLQTLITWFNHQSHNPFDSVNTNL